MLPHHHHHRHHYLDKNSRVTESNSLITFPHHQVLAAICLLVCLPFQLSSLTNIHMSSIILHVSTPHSLSSFSLPADTWRSE